MSKKIVVAEDFNVSRKIIVNLLSKAGYSILEAADGQEALQHFNGQDLDLLITDYNMPNMDGAELISEVRKNEHYSYIPILLLTTEVKEEKIQKALDEDITAWIKKPFQADGFLKIVNRALK